MNPRISTCRGCQAQTSGVKSRIAIPHTCGLEPKSAHMKDRHSDLKQAKRKLSEITPTEAMEITSMLIPIAFESGQTHAPGWKVVPYKELGIEFEGFRVNHKYNDFYVDFDLDIDEIKVGNDLEDDDIAIDAKTWFEVVARLNELGIYHEWQNNPK